jgi:hypothetical protein
MSRKHADLERELIDDLGPRTGRTLAQWMAAIDAAGLTDKNAIIDWLRPQGLTFAHASWLERIHNNGGRPIYIGIDQGAGTAVPAVALPPPPLPPNAARPAPPTSPSPHASNPLPSPGPRHTSPTPSLRQPPPTPIIKAATVAPSRPVAAPPRPADPLPRATAPPSVPESTLEVLLARGKGLRPLADMVLREIVAALPGSVAVPVGDLVSIGRPAELAVLLIGPRELRLGLDLGGAPLEGMVQRARIPGAGPRITHMVVLADARLVAIAIDLVRQADTRVNGS